MEPLGGIDSAQFTRVRARPPYVITNRVNNRGVTPLRPPRAAHRLDSASSESARWHSSPSLIASPLARIVGLGKIQITVVNQCVPLTLVHSGRLLIRYPDGKNAF